MDKFKSINFNIEHQGAVVINDCWILAEGKDVVALDIDLKSKYGEVFATGSSCNNSKTYPAVILSATDRSLHLDESVGRDELTTVIFIDYPEWTVWASDIGRYTLSVCLVNFNNIMKEIDE